MRRVVCAIEDPNPEIAGRGFAVLRDAGVAVDLGLCAEEARWMAAGHILRMTQGRPFVQLKIAVSGDGLIAPGDGAPVLGHGTGSAPVRALLRARADAILVGRKTVADDNPELTCRLPGLANRSPRRVILDAKFRTLADRQDVPDRRARAGDDLRRHPQRRPALSEGRRGEAHAGRAPTAA